MTDTFENRSKKSLTLSQNARLFCSTLLLEAHPYFFGFFNHMHRTKDSRAVRLSVVFSVTGVFGYL